MRQIQLLESPVVNTFIIDFPIKGDNAVIKMCFDFVPQKDQKRRIYINDTQYFNNVPQAAWELCIGGDRPAQKWL